MRFAPAAVAVILLVSSAGMRAAITVTLPPDRPIQLLAKKDKELLPVVAVKVRQPLVEVDGQLRGAGRETLRLVPAQRYAAGSVLIRNPRIIPALSVVEPTAGELGRGASTGRVPLQADGRDAPLGDADSLALRRSGTYDLPSRSDRSEVTFECVLAPDRPLEDCFLAVIVCAELERDRVERYRHGRAVTERVRAKKDAPLLLCRAVPPDLPPAAKQRWTGVTVNMDLEIDAGGAVASARVLDADKSELQDALAGALKHWLFLPRINGGVAVGATQRVALPL